MAKYSKNKISRDEIKGQMSIISVALVSKYAFKERSKTIGGDVLQCQCT